MTKFFSLAALVLLFTSCTTKKTNDDKHNLIADSLTNELNEIHKQGQFNGFAVAIVNDSGVLYQNGIGFANAESKQKYTANTIQNIASISKTLIGIALLKAQELGKLKLDDSISKYLPFTVTNPYFPEATITIRNLATHTSGIADNEYYGKKDYHYKAGQDLKKVQLSFEGVQFFNPPDSIISMKAFLENLLTKNGKWFTPTGFLKHKPGEIHEYSNVGATLAAYIIEVATGEAFDKFTAKYILKPLQMNASGWKFDDVDMAAYSRLYLKPDTLLPYYSMISYPDGNFITSASDMGKYMIELIKGYSGHGTLLTKESYAEIFKPQLTAANFSERDEDNPYSEGYNYGIFMGFGFTGNIGHTGGDPGVSSMMFFDPKTKIGRYLIINTDFSDKKGNDQFYAIWDKLEKYQYKLQ